MHAPNPNDEDHEWFAQRPQHDFLIQILGKGSSLRFAEAEMRLIIRRHFKRLVDLDRRRFQLKKMKRKLSMRNRNAVRE